METKDSTKTLSMFKQTQLLSMELWTVSELDILLLRGLDEFSHFLNHLVDDFIERVGITIIFLEKLEKLYFKEKTNGTRIGNRRLWT